MRLSVRSFAAVTAMTLLPACSGIRTTWALGESSCQSWDDTYCRGCQVDLSNELDSCDHCAAPLHAFCLHRVVHSMEELEKEIADYSAKHKDEPNHVPQYHLEEALTGMGNKEGLVMGK